MKSLILNLDEDLTNEQIDAIITKLQAQKKSAVKKNKQNPLTKEEKMLLGKMEKYLNNNYISEWNAMNIDDGENVCANILSNLEDDFGGTLGYLTDGIEDAENDIADFKDEIKELQDSIWSHQKDIKKFKKQEVKHKEMKKLFNRLNTLFAKR